MVIKELTEDVIGAGKQLITELDNSNLNISGALWLFIAELEAYKLIIAERSLSRLGPRNVYEKIKKVLVKKKIPLIELSNISLTDSKNPFILNLLTLTDTKKSIGRIRMQNTTINNVHFQDALIYRITK